MFNRPVSTTESGFIPMPPPSLFGPALLPPRAYAAQILQLKTKAERQEALAKVPEEIRDLVKKHVEIAWNHPTRNKTP